MRYWLLTSTFYGNWLPGDRRGFVSRVRDRRSGEPQRDSRREHNTYGEAFDADFAGLAGHAQSLMKGPIVQITREQAKTLLQQFLETAAYRHWQLLAVSVMTNYVHWVVGIEPPQTGSDALQSLKAYGSRALNKQCPRPASGTWWTSKGSSRLLIDDPAVRAAMNYVVRRQPNPLIVWNAELSAD